MCYFAQEEVRDAGPCKQLYVSPCFRLHIDLIAQSIMLKYSPLHMHLLRLGEYC